ncbi:MAG TPA: carboxypeptidase-like regulatory domain-containing protein [Bryobacteraceae bacterium]|nr:carboxypeptidase-like regulatory domain-containing protein [Bryobacteraceae bacterium]
MKTPLVIGCSIAAWLLGPSFLQSQTPAFSIAGRVVQHTDNNPVRGVRVTVFPVERPNHLIGSITGENGDFRFSGLPAGKYSLQVNYRGWTQAFQQLEQYSTAIAVGPKLDSEHILFPVNSPASIAGYVLDDGGDPVRGALVYLFTRSLRDGFYRTELESTTGTGPDGDFHFAHLAPGSYYVAVSGHPWYAQNVTPQPEQVEAPPPSPELDVAYPLTYYAGSLNPAGATPVQLDAGARAEIQILLHVVPALQIAFDGIEKDQNRQISGLLAQIGPGGTLISIPTIATNVGMGGVAPGDYVISLNRSGQDPEAIGSQPVSLTGNATLNVSEGIVTSVSGKVILDGEAPQNLAILLENVANGNQQFSAVARDKSFKIPEVTPGRYNLRLANTPELYMQAITARGAAYSKGVLDIRSGARVELMINLARGLSKVNGIAIRDNKPVTGAMILLLPQTFDHGIYIPRDQSDSDGTFTLNWAAPGRYTLVAIEDGNGLEYGNPAVIAPYLQAGRPVDLPAPSGANLKVEVQARR